MGTPFISVIKQYNRIPAPWRYYSWFMNYFLAKTDPETYSIDDLARDRRTLWDGVRNPLALRAIREMKPGDRVFVYHSMSEAAVMGMAGVGSEPPPGPPGAKLLVGG